MQAKGGITQDIVDALTQNNTTLSKMRKKRVISETLAAVDDVAALELAGSFPIHKTTQVELLTGRPDPFKSLYLVLTVLCCR